MRNVALFCSLETAPLVTPWLLQSPSQPFFRMPRNATMRPKNLMVFLCVTWAVAFTSACCREKQMDSLFTNVKRWCFDSILQLWIHTGFHRFTEIGHTFHVKYIFKNKNTFQVEVWPSQLNDSETQERGLKRVKTQIISQGSHVPSLVNN